MVSRDLILSLLMFMSFTGCEGQFAGNRSFDIDIVNGPMQMKLCTVGAVELLCAVNTNYQYKAQTGSIQFYSLTNPAQPVRLSTPATIEVSSNVSDFEVVQVDGNDVLFVLDRNANELLVYDLTGGSFVARQENGAAVKVDLPQNPQSIQAFQRSSDSKTFLAITVMRGGASGGSLVFIDPLDLSFYEPDESSPGSDVKLVQVGVPGARFFMSPRKTYDDPANPGTQLVDRLNVSVSNQVGVGLSKAVFLGGSQDLFVLPNFLASAVHSFRFSSFQNMSNIAWNLRQWREGAKLSDGSILAGSREVGIRGVDIDNLSNVYVSNRTDNQIYKIPASVFEAEEDDDAGTIRNTTGFKENVRDHVLETYPGSSETLEFDSNLADSVFPRLGDLLADKTGAGLAAQALWVIGIHDSKIYRISVPAVPAEGNPITISHSVVLGEGPRKLLGYPAAGPYQFVYVADLKNDVISVLNASDLTLAGEIKN